MPCQAWKIIHSGLDKRRSIPARWAAGLDGAVARIGGRFSRVEPRRRARAFVLGLLADLPRKNCWTMVEHAGGVSLSAAVIHAQLRRQGRCHGRKRVARLMRAGGLAESTLMRWEKTTIPRPAARTRADPCATYLLSCTLMACRPYLVKENS